MARDRTGEEREEPAAVEGPVCARCGDKVPLNTFPEDTPVLADRGARLCASCWIAALRRRMNNTDRHSRCEVPGCDLEVQDHIAHCQRIASSVAWSERYGGRRQKPS